MGSLGQGFTQLLKGAILGRILGAGTNIFLGRVLGTTGFGNFSLYLQLIQTSESLNRFGVDFALNYWTGDDPELRKRRSHDLASSALDLNVLLSVLTLITCGIYLSSPVLGFPWPDDSVIRWTRTAILLGVGSECLSNIPWAILLVQRQMKLVALQQAFFGPMKLIMASIGGWVGHVDGAMLAWSLGSSIQLGWLLLFRESFQKKYVLRPKVKQACIYRLLRKGLPFYTSNLVNQLVFFPLLISVASSAGVSDISFLRIGQVFAQLFGILSGALAPVLFLGLRSATKSKDAELMLRRSLNGGWALGLVAFSVFCLVDSMLIRLLFGEDYFGSVPATRILVSCAVLDALTQVSQQALLAKGKVKHVSFILNGTGILCAIAGWLLVPHYGIKGYLACRFLYSLLPIGGTLGLLIALGEKIGLDWRLGLSTILMIGIVGVQIKNSQSGLGQLQVLILIAIAALGISSAKDQGNMWREAVQ